MAPAHQHATNSQREQIDMARFKGKGIPKSFSAMEGTIEGSKLESLRFQPPVD